MHISGAAKGPGPDIVAYLLCRIHFGLFFYFPKKKSWKVKKDYRVFFYRKGTKSVLATVKKKIESILYLYAQFSHFRMKPKIFHFRLVREAPGNQICNCMPVGITARAALNIYWNSYFVYSSNNTLMECVLTNVIQHGIWFWHYCYMPRHADRYCDRYWICFGPNQPKTYLQ